MNRKNHIKLLQGILFFLFCSCLAIGQNFKPVANFDKIQAEINKTAESIKTIKSNFVQEKQLSFLNVPVKSEGLFRYKKENQLRWEYTEPFKYLILFNGNEIVIKDGSNTNVFDAGSNALFKQINDLMLGAVKGDLGKNKDFAFSLNESSGQYQLLLKPTNANMKKYVAAVEIYFEKADLAVSSIKIIESTGDFTKITFNDRKFNEPIDEKTFTSN
ncbi:MAG TPA: outer membrane lipoprotein carrier protein LolA [Draconibacterium sp.]|nr:outer membrane lipoprotein carrier protein LolA [Draconibacterium sp.]HRX12450.1 outer membrane lipoprotein carrier protein LolA [Draconibacterium sp.]